MGEAGPAAVLDRRGDARRRRPRSTRSCDHEPDRAPGSNSAGGERSGSNITASVRPEQVPAAGRGRGYTAVYSAAIATEPAGTRVRGVARRGRCRRVVEPAEVAEAGREPAEGDDVRAAPCGARPRRRSSARSPSATASRSAPSYRTGISIGRAHWPAVDSAGRTSRAVRAPSPDAALVGTHHQHGRWHAGTTSVDARQCQSSQPCRPVRRLAVELARSARRAAPSAACASLTP